MPSGSPDSPEFLDHLDDPSIKWHGLQPMDLGFLEKTLSEGLPASFQRPSGWWSLCVSGSPGTSVKDGHGFESFLNYTMEPSRVSIAVRTDRTGRPAADRLYFHDEYHLTHPVPPDGVVAIAVNDRTLATPLSRMRPSPAAIEFDRQMDYLQSGIDWAGRMCGPDTADKLQQRLLPPLPPDVHRTPRIGKETADRMAHIFQEVASHLGRELGREPTVADALRRTIQRAGSDAEILVWNDRTRQFLRDVNSRVAQLQPDARSLRERAPRAPLASPSTTAAASIRSVNAAAAPPGPAATSATGHGSLSWRRLRSLVKKPTAPAAPGRTM